MNTIIEALNNDNWTMKDKGKPLLTGGCCSCGFKPNYCFSCGNHMPIEKNGVDFAF